MTHVISMRHEHELRVTTDMLLSIKVLQTCVQGALLQHAQVTAERQEARNLGIQHGPAWVDGRRLYARHSMEDGVAFTIYKDAADGARLLRMKHCHDSAVNLSVDRRMHCTRGAHVARVSLATCPAATRSTVSTRTTHNTYTKHT